MEVFRQESLLGHPLLYHRRAAFASDSGRCVETWVLRHAFFGGVYRRRVVDILSPPDVAVAFARPEYFLETRCNFRGPGLSLCHFIVVVGLRRSALASATLP